MKHSRILVVGGSGFIGSHVVARLAAQNRNVIVPSRRRERSRHLIMLPTVEVVEANVTEGDQLAGLVARCDAVINLAGILHGRPGRPYGPEFRSVHVELPRRLAELCRRANLRRLIHLSALGVGSGLEATPPSMYLRSKAAGEQALREMPELDWTIMRPSVVFGPDDRFLNLFATLQRWLPVMLLARPTARFQPIFVGDVAQAIVNALDNPVTFGKTYELVGPEVFSLRDLVALAGRLTGHPRPIIGLSDRLGRLQAAMLEFAPGPTLMSRDNFDSLAVDNVAGRTDSALAADLGVVALPLSAIVPGYLRSSDRYNEARQHAHR